MGRALALLTETPNRIRYELYGLGTGHYVWIQELEGGKPASRHIAEKILGRLSSGGHSNVDWGNADRLSGRAGGVADF